MPEGMSGAPGLEDEKGVGGIGQPEIKPSGVEGELNSKPEGVEGAKVEEPAQSEIVGQPPVNEVVSPVAEGSLAPKPESNMSPEPAAQSEEGKNPGFWGKLFGGGKKPPQDPGTPEAK